MLQHRLRSSIDAKRGLTTREMRKEKGDLGGRAKVFKRGGDRVRGAEKKKSWGDEQLRWGKGEKGTGGT